MSRYITPYTYVTDTQDGHHYRHMAVVEDCAVFCPVCPDSDVDDEIDEMYSIHKLLKANDTLEKTLDVARDLLRADEEQIDLLNQIIATVFYDVSVPRFTKKMRSKLIAYLTDIVKHWQEKKKDNNLIDEIIGKKN